MANNFELLRQALSASESSINLAKKILSDIEKGRPDDKPKTTVLPGMIGTFDGENMVTESGENHPVPANYASKSMLVVGDTLKLVDEKGGKKFKQIEHVKRHKTTGVLTKKEGKFHVVATEGSYKVLPAAVDHFNASFENELNIWIPAKNMTASWAAIESVVGKEKVQEQKPKIEEIKAPPAEKEEEPSKKVAKETASEPVTKAKEKVTKVEKPKEETKEKAEKESKPEEKISKVVKEDKPKKSEPTKTTQPKPAPPSTVVKKTTVKEDIDDEELA